MSYRQFERLPAAEYARRHRSVHNQLEAELQLQAVHKFVPEPANDFTDDPSGSGRMLVAAFGAGALFWMILGWAFT